MGQDQGLTMRYLLLFGLSMMMAVSLYSKNCSDYEEDYELAKFAMSSKELESYRKAYDLVNTLIDSATEYLAYCKEETSLDQQYQIRQEIKRAAKKRESYFKGAVREYHAIYGIRPNVREIYQDGGGYSTGGGRAPGYSSPPRFPAVRQPQMPPVR